MKGNKIKKTVKQNRGGGREGRGEKRGGRDSRSLVQRRGGAVHVGEWASVSAVGNKSGNGADPHLSRGRADGRRRDRAFRIFARPSPTAIP